MCAGKYRNKPNLLYRALVATVTLTYGVQCFLNGERKKGPEKEPKQLSRLRPRFFPTGISELYNHKSRE